MFDFWIRFQLNLSKIERFYGNFLFSLIIYSFVDGSESALTYDLVDVVFSNFGPL